jgi:cell shape-determining protein MreC
MTDEQLRVVLRHVEDLRAENEQLRSTLVTKRDMADADKLAEVIAKHLVANDEPFMPLEWRHDIAQAIADGRRRAMEPKL